MLEAGEDPLFVARRLVILAAEDVGLADPQGLVVANACYQAVHAIGMPEAYLPLAECALYLALAPKSNSAITTYRSVLSDVADTLSQPVPLHLRNAVTSVDRALSYGKGYQYAHDFDGHYVDQEHLPEKLRGRRYYESSGQGQERLMGERLAARRERQE
jgi:putative ATPase